MSPDDMDLEQAAEWLNQLGDEGQRRLAKIMPPEKDEIEQLHFHAPRMVALLNLMVEARDTPMRRFSEADVLLAMSARNLADLFDARFQRQMLALFTKLADRRFTLIPRETP